MAVAAGITVAWAGAANAIPAGWARAAALDGFYLRGAAAGVDPGLTGGSSTHTHTPSSGHTHNIAAHTHATGFDGGYSAVTNTNLLAGVVAIAAGLPNEHTHTWGGVTAAASSADTTDSITPAWNNANNDPSHLSVLWIQSDGTPQGLPPFALAYWNSNALPAGWAQHPAAKVTYLKGAATGADGGIAAGNSAHTHTGTAHAHTATGHTHTGPGAGTSSAPTTGSGQATGIAVASSTHTHPYTFTTWPASAFATSSQAGTTSTDSGEPPYYVLGAIQNASGAVSTPLNIIVVWTSSLASIPASWVLCNGSSGTPDLRTQFIRGANLLAEIGTTGGSTTHSHTGGSHTHLIPHSHALASGAESDGGTSIASSLSSIQWATAVHTHTIITGGASIANSDNGTIDAVAPTDTRPPYYDVAYIQYQATGTVSVTTPAAASTQTTPFFTAVWALSGGRTQASYHVVIYENDGVTVHWDSGVVNSASVSVQTPTAPSGPPYPAQQLPGLQNGGSYKFQVTTVDMNGIVSVSSVISFTAAWTTPVELSGVTTAPVGGT